MSQGAGPRQQAAVDREHLRLGAPAVQLPGGEPGDAAVFVRLGLQPLPLAGCGEEKGKVEVEVGRTLPPPLLVLADGEDLQGGGGLL